MQTSVMIKQLKAVADKERNKKLDTFETNISALATDCACKLEELNASIESIREDILNDNTYENDVVNYYLSYIDEILELFN